MDVVLFTISPLGEIIRDYTGLGKTGETILGRLNEKGQAVLFFAVRNGQESEQKAPISRHSTIAKQVFKIIWIMRIRK